MEWIKENPEVCSFCSGRVPLEETEDIYGTAIESSWCGKYLLIPRSVNDGYRKCFISFCPMCGRDLRET
ncbi:MAG: hypothetical protein LUH36_07175 [Oscillospiraceae bacterium]|nr:hypothetical protein [Oscillospiraceae bacterium]